MKKTVLTLIAASAALSAFAVPARPGIHTVTQPDGSTIQVYIVGDEHRHIYLTTDSLPLAEGRDGFMQYATFDKTEGCLRATGVRASADIKLRTASERATIAALSPRETFRSAMTAEPSHRRQRRAIAQSGLGLFDSTFPVFGDVKALVILVNYKDVKFKTPNPTQYFSDLLMKDGFDEYNGTGSAYNYFYDNSMGQFRPQFDCYGPVELPQKRSYYGGNDYRGDDKAPEDMIIHAVSILDDEVDFSQYDTDGDGFVDNVYVFYAGDGEAGNGGVNSVWPHSYNIYTGAGKLCRADGVTFDYYACSNEWAGSRPDGIGTFVHEFSHVMGLPDLYAVDYNDEAASITPGEWSVLDVGNYNNDSRTPAGYSAYERNALGWLEPIVLDGPASVRLENIAESNECYIIPTESTNEFFLLENRQKQGWDAQLPGHGMLVWHIDFDQRVWNLNSVNVDAAHQHVDIVEAGGSANNIRRTVMATYPFPGTDNKTSFTSSTTPALKSWAGEIIDLPLTEITESDGIISFNVAGGSTGLSDVATDAGTGQFSVAGSMLNYSGAAGERVSVYDTLGRCVAITVADGSGYAGLELQPGIYVAKTASTSAKVAVH